jgi:hypothetical protein
MRYVLSFAASSCSVHASLMMAADCCMCDSYQARGTEGMARLFKKPTISVYLIAGRPEN